MQIINMSIFPEDVILLLERAHYEVESRKNIIKLIILDNLNDYYNEYWEDYLLYLKTYNTIQNNFWNQYLPQYKDKKYKIDFDSKQIIIK